MQRITEEHDLESIDVLKMDIEGSEREVLMSSAPVLRHTRTVIFEYHQERHSDTLWKLLDQLTAFRLVRLKGDSRQHPVVTLTRLPATS